ncbi:MAG: DUF4347 domain-containing protein, partial [Alphaproteobacteria bacterium]|nr:DUF4347 domain-containing protein [Alphaproteobacteria bacterium]
APPPAAEPAPEAAPGAVLVFVDPRVPEHERVEAAIPEGAILVELDPARDGIEQVTEVLKSYQDVDAIHFLTHGREGGATLAGTEINLATVEARSDELAAWGDHLAQGADLLFYGCEVGKGEAGAALVSALASVTGADVAASSNDTGHESLGADWALETTSGDIDAGIVISAQFQADYYSFLTATIDLSAASSSWTAVLTGAAFDPGQDLQAQAAIDLQGNASNPLLYMWFDDKGTVSTTDDELALRLRVDQAADQQGDLNGYVWLGIDVDSDNDLDIFLTIDGGGNGNAELSIYDAGTGANTSPNTSSIENQVVLATLTAGAGTLNFSTVASIDTSGNGNVDSDGNTDYFISVKFNFDTFATAANLKQLTGSVSNVSTLNSNAGLTKDTTLRYVVASAQQANALNGDIGGYNSTDDYSVTFASKGAFSSTTSLGNPGVVAGDSTAPAAPTVTLNAASDSGASNSDRNTNDDTPSVRVTLPTSGSLAVANDVVNVYYGGNSVGTATLSATDITNGYVDITTTTLGADGSKSLTAKITDTSNNASDASTALEITLDKTAPVIASAAVNGASLVLTYTEANTLDATNKAGTGTFTVTAGGATINVTAVAVDSAAKTVTLTLASAVTAGQVVTVSYADPTGGDDASATQDAAGNDAASLTNQAVTNNTPDTTAPAAPTLTLNAASDSGASNSDRNTNDDTPSVRVTLPTSGSL